MLRSNPKDSSLERLLTILSLEYQTLALIWDREDDYEAPLANERLEIRRCLIRGRYHHISTLWGIARLQPWLALATLRARPRVVHAMDLDTGLVGLVLARILRVPFVYQCLDPYAGSLPSTWPRLLGRLVNRLENLVISGSDLFVITDLKRIPQHRGATPRRVVEFANVPLLATIPAPSRNGGFLVGYIGSLVPHRSLDVIIDTVGDLAPEGVRLILGGFGPLSRELEAQAAAYSNIEFRGWVPSEELMSTMATFDVFVQIEDPKHPAYRWVSPNKVFESMALGRPIIVAAGTLAAERVRESGHGLAVTYGNASELRATLMALHRDAVRRADLGHAGRAEYLRAWTPVIVGAKLLGAYRGATQRYGDSHGSGPKALASSARRLRQGRQLRQTGDEATLYTGRFPR